MRKKELITLADTLGLVHFDTTDNLMVVCPFSEWTHGKGRMQNPPGSMSWHVKNGESEYNCHACERHGINLTVMLLQLEDVGFFNGRPGLKDTAMSLVDSGEAQAVTILDSFEEATRKSTLYKLAIPPPMEIVKPEAILERYLPVREVGGAALAYLQTGRRQPVDPLSMSIYDIRFDLEYDRIAIPVRWHTGELIGMVGRMIRQPVGEELAFYAYWKYPKGLVLFGEQLLRREPVVVVEGQFNVIRLREAGYNAVGTLGAKYRDVQLNKLVEWGEPVIVFYDNDEAGHKYATRLVRDLTARQIPALSVFPVSGYDAADYDDDALDATLGPFVARFRGQSLVTSSIKTPLKYWGPDDVL